jgi:multidrug efflux pump subunit AcrB
LISLSLSWVTAVTTTPLLCKTFLKGAPKPSPDGKEAGGEKDPYGGFLFRIYKKLLITALGARWMSVLAAAVLFLAAILGFSQVKNSFFPDSTTPQYYVDFFFPEGTHIDETMAQLRKAEKLISQKEGVQNLVTMAGGAQIRFMLTYTPEYNYSSFGQILVSVDDYRLINEQTQTLQTELEQIFPQANINVRKFVLGPASGGKIQLRIYGADPKTLRDLADKASAVISADPLAKALRNEWRRKIKVLTPRMAETQARRAGIDRPQLASALQAALDGARAGSSVIRTSFCPS